MGWKLARTFLPARQSLTPGGQGEKWPEGSLSNLPQNFSSARLAKVKGEVMGALEGVVGTK